MQATQQKTKVNESLNVWVSPKAHDLIKQIMKLKGEKFINQPVSRMINEACEEFGITDVAGEKDEPGKKAVILSLDDHRKLSALQKAISNRIGGSLLFSGTLEWLISREADQI